MNEKPLYTGQTKKGTDIVIRYPTSDDLDEMLRYINTISLEQTFIRFQGEQMTREAEQKFLDSVLASIAKKTKVCLCVFHGKELIGLSALEMRDKVEQHIGNFGISIAKDYRGEGIGMLLMNMVLKEAKKNIATLKICTLSVFANNTIAREMYKNCGFKEYGILPHGILHRRTFVDHVYMYKD